MDELIFHIRCNVSEMFVKFNLNFELDRAKENTSEGRFQ